jgi:hypothetical protein
MKIKKGYFTLYHRCRPIASGRLPIVSASAPHVYFEVPKEAIRI